MTPAEMSSAATFEAWATGAAAIAMAVAVFLGGLWAVFRFLLPGLFGAAWEGGLTNLSIRRIEHGRFTQVLRFELKNVSYLRSVAYEMAIIFSARLPSSDEERNAWLKTNSFKVNWRFKPGVASVVTSTADTGPPLRDGVFVAWRIKFRQPRLGIGWLPWSKHEIGRDEFVPIDEESLTLYSKWREPFVPTVDLTVDSKWALPAKGKEETS